MGTVGGESKKSKRWLGISIVGAIIPWIGVWWIEMVHNSYPIEWVVANTGEVNASLSRMYGWLALACVVILAVMVAAIFFVKGKRRLIVVATLLLTAYTGYMALSSYALLK